MKRFLAIGLLMLLAAAVSGQTNDSSAHGQAGCRLSIAQAPVIGGLRLGMTPEQVTALFPGSREDSEVRTQLSRPPSADGVSSFIIRPEKFSSKSKYAGVSQIILTLLDGHVSTLNVGYNGQEWKHVDDFVTKFTAGTNLPAAHAWEAYVGMDSQLKTLKCKDFEIRIFAGGKNAQNINYVQMQDMAALEKLKERREKAKQKNWWGTDSQ